MTQIETKQYVTTREECQHQINSHNRVCQQCGGKLAPIQTVDNAGSPTFWSGCERCCIFSYGVEPIIFAIAKDMVENQHYVPYSSLSYLTSGDDAQKKYWLDSQIGGASDLVLKVMQTYKKLTRI